MRSKGSGWAKNWLIVSLCLASTFWGFSLPAAARADDEVHGGGAAPAITIEDSQEFVNHDFQAVVPAERPSDIVTPQCARWRVEVDLGGFAYFVCAAYYDCAAERIDDVVSGRFSGSGGTGGFAEYVAHVESNILAFGVPPGEAVNDEFRRRLAAAVADANLGDPITSVALPVFYYCRVDGVIDFAASFPHGPRFEWDTTVGAEYDIPGARRVVLDRLRQVVAAAIPEPRSIPPLDEGKTYIKFPMWFWLHDPVAGEGVYSESDLETIRIEARAVFDRVVYDWGTDSVICEWDDMDTWVDGLHPWDDRPDCHRVVDEMGTFDLTATVFYEVHYRILMRLSSIDPWPDPPWITHNVQLTAQNSVGPIEVRELLTLNVSEEQQSPSGP